ncbi:MAG: nucleotidyltransferase [Elusimicrobiota bacterium]|nr:nucleotidyltransferase [Elusimicrobiota bacterium]
MRAKNYGESLLLLLDIADELNNLKIPYAVIGAAAVSVYGLPRASLDADAVIQIERGEENKFCIALKKKGIVTELRKGACDDPISTVIKAKDKYGNRVDLLSGIRSVKHDIFSRAKKVKFRKDFLTVTAPEDLIVMKALAGSYQDIEDIKGIIQVWGKKLDKTLLREIIAGYGKRIQKKISSLL